MDDDDVLFEIVQRRGREEAEARKRRTDESAADGFG